MAVTTHEVQKALESSPIRVETYGVTITSTASTFNIDISNEYTPSSIILTGIEGNIYTMPTYMWEYLLDNNDDAWSIITGEVTDTLVVTSTLYDSIYTGSTFVKFRLTVSQANKPTAQATYTVFNNQEVESAVSGYLTRETYLVATDSAGVIPVGGLTPAGGTFRVFEGTTEKTNTGSVAYSIIDSTGLTASIGATSGVYTIDSMSADTGTVTFRAIYNSIVTIDKQYTITKAKAGIEGTSANKYATATLYQWSTTEPTIAPSGTSTYTWSTGVSSAYTPTGGGSWEVTTPANPGISGIRLWTVSKAVTDVATAVTTTVTWVAPFVISAVSANGADGVPGYQTAEIKAYQWSVPPAPTSAGSATYNWSTGTYDILPSGWTVEPGTGIPGETLYAAIIRITALADETTTGFFWGNATVSPIGYQGTDGSGGTDAKILTVSANSLTFKEDKDGVVTPNSIEISASGQNLAGDVSWSTVPVVTLGGLPTATTRTLSKADFGTNNSVAITATWDTFTDTVNIIRLIDGVDGLDSYTVLLSNESHIFPGSTNAAINGSTTSTVKAYKGSTQFAATVGTITGAVTGLTTSITNNGTTAPVITIDVTTALVTQNGVLTVPITVDGVLFTKIISWSVAYVGADGTVANNISLTTTTQVLAVPAAGGATTPTTAVVTGTSQGTTISVWQYSVDGGAFSSTVPTGVSRTGNTVTITGSTMTAKTIAVLMGDGSLSDILTIAKISDGADGTDVRTAILTNEAHTIPSDSDGSNPNFSGSGTLIYAYSGTTALQYETGTGNPIVNGRFRVTFTTSSVTSGSTSGSIAVSGTAASVSNLTAMTADTGSITYTINTRTDGVNLSLTKVQTFSKSKQGTAGTIGSDGVSARRAYAASSVSAMGTTSVTSSGINSVPATGSFSPGVVWYTTPPTYATGERLWQTDGLYDPDTLEITWYAPYISAFKVGQLSALTVNTGSLTVDGTLTVGTAGQVSTPSTTFSSTTGYFLGYDAGQYKVRFGNPAGARAEWNGTTFSIYNSSNQVVFSSGGTVNYSQLTGTPASSIANSSISISSDGTLSGAGGGTVTIGGLGYTGALDATKNIVYRQSSAPTSPVNGDVWVDTSVTPNITKVRVAGAWQSAANLTTATSQLTDDAGLGLSATWNNLVGTPPGTVLNSNITISSDGALSGAGGGTVTLGGLGYTGETNATRNALTVGTTAPVSPVNGDLWYDSSTWTMKVRSGGVWVSAGDITANKTAQAIAGQGAFATLSQITAANATTYIGAAAIDLANIKVASIGTLAALSTSTGSLTVGSPGVGGLIKSLGKVFAGATNGYVFETLSDGTVRAEIGNGTYFLRWNTNGVLEVAGNVLIGDMQVSTNGKLRSGKTAYGSGTGWLIEYNGGTPRLDIGSADAYMRWTGSQLEIKSPTYAGPKPSMPLVGVLHVAATTGTRTASASVNTNGTLGSRVGTGSWTYTQNWWNPTTAGVGTGRYVRFSKLSILGSGAVTWTGIYDSWTQITSEKIVAISKTYSAYGEDAAVIGVEIASDASGSNIISTGYIRLWLGYIA
jgi:hypothetical protein